MADSMRILAIDDDARARALVALVAAGRLAGAEVCPVGGALDFAEQLAEGRWDAAVVEPDLSWGEGLAVVEQLCRRHPRRPVVVFAARDRSRDAVRAISAGALDYLPKTAEGALRLGEVLAEALGLPGTAWAPAADSSPRPTGRPPRPGAPSPRRRDSLPLRAPPPPGEGPPPGDRRYGERWRALAAQARARGQRDLEARALDNALENDPDDDDAFDRLVELHDARGRWSEAVELLRGRVARTRALPRMRALYKRLIDLLAEKLGRAEDGLQTYLAWRRRDPDNAELRRVLITLLRRLGRWEVLLVVLRDLAAEAKERGEKRRWLMEIAALLEGELGRPEEAAAARREAAMLPPDLGRRPVEREPLPAAERMTRPFRVAGGRKGAVLELVSEQVPRSADAPSGRRAHLSPAPAPLAAVAHDLQEPIRSVANYLEVLRSRHGEALGEEVLSLIERASGAARRMQARVQGLMDAASAEGAEREGVTSEDPEQGGAGPDPGAAVSEPVVLPPVDCTEVIARTLEDLEDSIARSGAHVTLGALPHLPVDPTALGQLFQNLISNAIKYRGDAPPRVRITARERGQAWEFAVQDNGVGVPEAERERVFEMFQRGGAVGHVPGTGIGLALCRKTVEAMGGRIWIEDGEGQGTRVCFTVALAAPPAEPRQA